MTSTAAIYCRVSTSEQAAEDRSSLDQQEARCRSWADAQDLGVADVYIDPGVSGTLPLVKRPAGGRLLADAAAKRFDRVVVLKLDRWTRSASKGLRDIEALESFGVGFASVSEGFDTTTPSGKFMRTMLAAVAELERDTIAERMDSGQRALAEAGRWATGFVPFGYATDENGSLTIAPEEAEVVRRVFNLRATGDSATAIAEQLNREGVLSPSQARGYDSAAPWSSHSVMALLRAGRFLGSGVERTIGGHDPAKCTDGGCEKCGEVFTWEAPAIVTAHQWDAAHAERKSRRVVEGRGERRYSYALGSGRLQHDHEGWRRIDGEVVPEVDGEESPPVVMFGQRRPVKDGVARYYRCGSARKGRDGSPSYCPGLGVGPWGNGGRVTAIRADAMEARVLLWALDLLESPERLAAYLQAADAATVEAANGDTIDPAEVQARLVQLSARSEATADNYAAGAYGVLGSDQAKAKRDQRLADLRREADVLEAVLIRAEEDAADRDTLRLNIEALLGLTVATGGDPSPLDEDGNPLEPEHASAQSRQELRSLALRVLADGPGRAVLVERADGADLGWTNDEPGEGLAGPDHLTPEVVAEVTRYIEALAVEVTVTPNADASLWPVLRLSFNPSRVGLQREGSPSSRNGCRAGYGIATRPPCVHPR